MIKKNGRILVLTSVLCLLPLVLSCAVYRDLPTQIAVHWDIAGNPNQFLPKAAAAFGLPLFFAAINIFTGVRLFYDPKRAGASRTMRAITLWIIPLLSLITVPVTLFIAMGASIPIPLLVQVLTGVVLIVTGNYLPKSRQNYAIGIKLPWTLHSADNWNKTHRIAGYLYIIGGLALLVFAFLPFDHTGWGVAIAVVVGLLVLAPALYSFLLHKRHADGGTWKGEDQNA